MRNILLSDSIKQYMKKKKTTKNYRYVCTDKNNTCREENGMVQRKPAITWHDMVN